MTKVSKSEADYRRRETGGKVCCSCASMKDDGTCQKVEGVVACDYTCDLWTVR